MKYLFEALSHEKSTRSARKLHFHTKIQYKTIFKLYFEWKSFQILVYQRVSFWMVKFLTVGVKICSVYRIAKCVKALKRIILNRKRRRLECQWMCKVSSKFISPWLMHIGFVNVWMHVHSVASVNASQWNFDRISPLNPHVHTYIATKYIGKTTCQQDQMQPNVK